MSSSSSSSSRCGVVIVGADDEEGCRACLASATKPLTKSSSSVCFARKSAASQRSNVVGLRSHFWTSRRRAARRSFASSPSATPSAGSASSAHVARRRRSHCESSCDLASIFTWAAASSASNCSASATILAISRSDKLCVLASRRMVSPRCRPVAWSVAVTWRMPSASMANSTSICGRPAGAGAMPPSVNSPSNWLSLVSLRSPWKMRIGTCGWSSRHVV
mmetsp:Transcript_26334/g.105396  ORF Transcript_26334/g.105396 Transcript_26334/m.105396 type:complete len:220 (-) Transcript_26334:195-854(-)